MQQKKSCFEEIRDLSSEITSSYNEALAELIPEKCHGHRVLVIDDDQVDAMMIAKPLVAVGYECLICTPGEVIDLLKRNGIGMVITDVQMPSLNGLGVVKLLQKSKVPCLVVSGMHKDFHLIKEITAMGIPFLPKRDVTDCVVGAVRMLFGEPFIPE